MTIDYLTCWLGPFAPSATLFDKVSFFTFTILAVSLTEIKLRMWQYVCNLDNRAWTVEKLESIVPSGAETIQINLVLYINILLKHSTKQVQRPLDCTEIDLDSES